ncbi:MAG: zinc ribbon domain-containing protein [Pyrinomonadaceae bacterium]
MSLVLCPDCGHELSTAAIACPNCGLPVNAPVVARHVVVAPREDSFPPWGIALIAIGGILVLLVAFLIFRQSNEDANSNLSVNVNTRRPTNERATTTVPSTAPQGVSVPPPSAPAQTTTVPGTTTSVPNPPSVDKGSVTINAKITTANGSPRAASGTKFYLLDKDVESILSEARVEPIEGNSLAASLGLAAVFPDRYGDFQRAAMRAIGNHVKYSGTTSAAGNTGLKSVEPNSYYLFAISRVGRGFALWNQSVSIIPGDNVMNLSPQAITEIPDPNG